MPPSLLRADTLTKIVTSGEAPLTILDDVSFDVEPGAIRRDRRCVRARARRRCWG